MKNDKWIIFDVRFGDFLFFQPNVKEKMKECFRVRLIFSDNFGEVKCL